MDGTEENGIDKPTVCYLPAGVERKKCMSLTVDYSDFHRQSWTNTYLTSTVVIYNK